MKLFQCLAAAAVLSACSVSNTMAQSPDYPVKPVNAIIAFPPGTPGDIIVRLIAEPFRLATKHQLIPENRPGAGGNIGAELAARSNADGYFLLASIDTVVTVNPHIYKKLNFKANTDLVPVIYFANTAQTLVCHPGVPVKTVPEFIAYAKGRDLSYASGGQGVPGHLAAELFIAATGVKMTHIPYKGPAMAAQDVLGGVVPCGFLATPVVMPHVKSGKLTGLAVTSAKRSPIAPEIPTMAEAGVAGYEASFGEVLLAPKGTPEAVITRLNETISAILLQPAVRERMLAADLEFVPNSPAQAAARLQAETQKWRKTVERLGLQVD